MTTRAGRAGSGERSQWGSSAEPETSPPETIRVGAAMPQIRSPVD